MKNPIQWKQTLSKCKVFFLGLILLTVSFAGGSLAKSDEPVVITAENADKLEELYSWQAYNSAVARLGFMLADHKDVRMVERTSSTVTPLW